MAARDKMKKVVVTIQLYNKGSKDIMDFLHSKLLKLCLVVMLFVLSGCEMIIPSGRDVQGSPVEPIIAGEKDSQRERILEGRFSMLLPQIVIDEIKITDDGFRVMVSSANRLALLALDGRLLWEKVFDQPLARSAFTADGETVVAGTKDGKVSVIQDSEVLWEEDLALPLLNLNISDDGSRIMVAVASVMETEEKRVITFDGKGSMLWEKHFPRLLSAKMSINGKSSIVLSAEEERARLYFLDQEGKVLWEEEGFTTAEISQDGKYVAAVSAGMIHLFDRRGNKMWDYDPGVDINQLIMSRDQNYFLAYNHFGGGDDNLFYFDMEGELLWQKRIRDDSQVALSEVGQRIVVASWRHYSEDFTLVNVFDSDGRLRREIEVGSRIEKIALGSSGKYLAAGCDGGDVYILNLDRETLEEFAPRSEDVVYYTPSMYCGHADDEDNNRFYLYFYDENAMVLVPVSREAGDTRDVVRRAVEELVKGPRTDSYLVRTIPKNVSIGTDLEGSVLYVDLPGELEEIAGSTQGEGIINSLLLTATQFSGVDKVMFLVEGEKVEYFGDPGVYIAQPLESSKVKEEPPVLYLPYRSGFRYYLTPRGGDTLMFADEEKSDEKREKDEEEKAYILADNYFRETAGFLPSPVAVKGVEARDKEIVLDLSSSFLEVFERPEDPQLRARAGVILDGLTATLTKNLHKERIIITVEGKELPYLPGFAEEMPFYLQKPLCINPEYR